MTHYFSQHEDTEPFKSIKDSGERQEFIKGLHLAKTDLFMRMVESGAMPLRPGVQRLVDEARQASVKLAVCSTSNERAVQAIVDRLLGPEVAAEMRVFAGDVVPKKKPDPAIYLLAAEQLGLAPGRVWVVEDSEIGWQAAKGAGMKCVVTTSSYTKEEDFSGADRVHDCIGDAGQERFSLSDLQV